jgi:hypothetical protein
MVSDYCSKNVELYCDEATFEFILHVDFIVRFVDPIDKVSFWLEISPFYSPMVTDSSFTFSWPKKECILPRVCVFQ